MVGLAVCKALLKAFVAAAVAHIHHVAFMMKLVAQMLQVCAQLVAKVIPHSNVLSFGANVVHLPFVKFFGEIFTVIAAGARPAWLHLMVLPARLCVGVRFTGSSCAEVPAQCIAAGARTISHIGNACAKIAGIKIAGHVWSSSSKK